MFILLTYLYNLSVKTTKLGAAYVCPCGWNYSRLYNR